MCNLLEIIDLFSSKLNYFGYMIWQCWQLFNSIFECLGTILYDFEKLNGLIVLFERPKLVPQTLACLVREKDQSF